MLLLYDICPITGVFALRGIRPEQIQCFFIDHYSLHIKTLNMNIQEATIVFFFFLQTFVDKMRCIDDLL